MTEPTIKQQLQELREQIEALSGRVPGANTPATRAGEGSLTGADSAAQKAKEFAADIDWAGLARRIGEQMTELGEDVKASRPKALLTAFAAGVLVGRLGK